MEFDLSVPEISDIASILAAQAGISDCDPDDPCDCPCNCLQINKVVVTVDRITFTTRRGEHSSVLQNTRLFHLAEMTPRQVVGEYLAKRITARELTDEKIRRDCELPARYGSEEYALFREFMDALGHEGTKRMFDELLQKDRTLKNN